MNLANKKIGYLLCAAFLISVIIRLPNINRPLSKHHEFNAAMVLNVCSSWENAGGPSKFNYTPVTDYGNVGDALYSNNNMIVNGKLYYASMGQMQFLLPYYSLKLFNANYTPLNLQIFSILLHAILVVLFYLFCKKYFENKVNSVEMTNSATLLFIFLPNFLWFFSNAYSHESLVLICFLGLLNTLYVKNAVLKMFLILFIITFGILTDWYMLLVAILFVIYNVYSFGTRKNSENLIFGSVAFFAILVALILIYSSYKNEMGHANLIALLKEKFFSRTSLTSSQQWTLIEYIKRLGTNLLSGYLCIILLITFFYKSVFMLLRKIRLTKVLLFLVIAPLLYNFILIEFSVRHDYANMKYAFACIIFCVSIIPDFRKVSKLLLGFYIFFSCILYYSINYVNYTSLNYNKAMGTYIHNNCKPTDRIFIDIQNYNYPAIMYYAKRTIHIMESEAEIKNHVKMYNIENAIYIPYSGKKIPEFQIIPVNNE